MEKTYKVLYGNHNRATIIAHENGVKRHHLKANGRKEFEIKIAELESQGFVDVDKDKYKDIAKMVVDYYPKEVKF